MIVDLRRSRVQMHILMCVVLFLIPMRALAQSLPTTPPDQLAVQLSEGNSYYFEPEFPASESYSVRGGVIDPSLVNMSASSRKAFTESGMIDQFVRTAYFTPDFINSPMFPTGPSSIIVQVRVLTFPSDQQAASYVNMAYAQKVLEFRESQSTEMPTDLTDVPWNDEAVSGYSIPTVATDTGTGLNIEYQVVNYAGQHGSIVIMSRVTATPDLAEPIAREFFYAQMSCAEVDAPCRSFLVPVGEYPQTLAIENQNGGGSTSTSVGEAGLLASDTDISSPDANLNPPETAVVGTLPGYDHQLESSGDWLLLPSKSLNNNIVQTMPMRGTNDNFIVAGVSNLEGADRVAAVLSFLAPEIGTPTLIEDGGTYMLHVVEVNGVTYGIFSTIEVYSSALDAVVQIYIAPLSTFGVGMTDVQSSVLINGTPVMPNVDGAALVPAFGGTVGDPAIEAALPPLIGG